MKTISRNGMVFTALVWASQVCAQDACQLEDSEQTCRAKYQQQANQTKAKVAALPHDVADGLADKTTGMAQAVAGELATSFSDFFSTFKAAADTEAGEDDEEAVGFEFSRCLREQTSSSAFQCQARLKLGGAKLYQPLKQALPEATRDDRATELEKGFDLGDSVTAGIFFNYVSERYGRVPRFGSNPLFADIWNHVNRETEASTEEADKATEDFEKTVTEIIDGKEMNFDESTKFSAVAKKDPALGKKALRQLEAKLSAEFGSMADMRQQLVDSRYFDLVNLVNNQPQLSLGVEYGQRSELAGPDEWRAKFLWEMGFVNVNSASDYVYKGGCRLSGKEDPGAGATPSARAVACLNKYLGDAKTQKRLKAGDRVALSVEYVRRKKYAVVLADDEIDFDQPGEKSLIGGLSYGYYLAFDDANEPTSRLDIKGTYEDVSSDPHRQDRGVVAATFSQRVFGATVLAVTLVYATKAEFRGDVGDELGAHVGLNYKWGKASAF